MAAMNRLVLLPVAVVALAACGAENVTTEPPTTAAPGGTAAAPAVDAIVHPTTADQAIVRLSLGGGLVPEGADFHTPPQLVILGDGTVFRQGPQIEIYPGPLLPAITKAKLDEAGMQAVLHAASEAGLLAAPPAYDIPPGAAQIADAPATTLQLRAGGGEFAHTAYALGLGAEPGTETTPARTALNDFVIKLQDLATLSGGHLSADEVYEPQRFGVIARPATPEELAPTEEGPAPQAVAWPEAAGKLAAGAGTCVEPPAAALLDPFKQANQLTRFTQDGATYVVFVRVLLPNESCSQFA
jgi:hypothetical protein